MQRQYTWLSGSCREDCGVGGGWQKDGQERAHWAGPPYVLPHGQARPSTPRPSAQQRVPEPTDLTGDAGAQFTKGVPATVQLPSRRGGAAMQREGAGGRKEAEMDEGSSVGLGSAMFSWVSRDARRRKEPELFRTVSEGLRQLYAGKLLPLEEQYRFHDFHSPALEPADWESKPMVLLVGQYSTGKTTFIRHLLEQDFPGMRIGPEPTTDSFIAVMGGESEGVIPGNALVVDPRRPFRKLNAFGNAFLNRFMCAQLPNPVLDSISIIDTPGILSGEKQRISRGYDFAAVLEWFAERVDRIILLFDAHKLDISDEFSEVIKSLKNHEDKIRVVLNKADQIETQQLMRVYGALMWSLGKIVNTPEVVRVYIGSFWSHPLLIPDNRKLFEAEEQDLFRDIQSLPRNAALRKLNDLIKRARLAKVHAYIISALKKEMPNVFGKESKKKELVSNLGEIYLKIEREHQISPGDFPSLRKMQEQLMVQDFGKFQPLKPKLLEAVDDMLAHDIARLMVLVRQEEAQLATPGVKGGAFEGSLNGPFGPGYGEGAGEGIDDAEWVVGRDKPSYDEVFYSLSPVNGKITGASAKKEMVKSKLPNTVLGKIWKLADVDKDGLLDDEEFALANHLIKVKLEGHELPAELPAHLVPPSKRRHE
ncbi:EH domain-containing protein 1 [Hemicordylus capensis]|uniref:EH domain-containing protein 1 n=1 Tax=Hemicordylus capensis TaxID=884348 RepID=UPI002304A9BE|nr:EH domain-containing protein 1 [Hemicordylus capensis]